jgi:hypothetical protein
MANPFSNGYIEPSTPSNYLKLTEGSHLFRIITPKTEVISYFVEYKENPEDKTKNIKIVTKDIGDGNQPKGTKKVWSLLVFNKDQQKVQIAEFPQQSIRDYLFNIAKGKIKNDWTKFDIQITRTGQALDTVYSIVPDDNSELTPEEQKIVKSESRLIQLQAMEYGKDPFDQSLDLSLLESVKPPLIEEVFADDLPNPEEIDISGIKMPY